MPAPSAWYTYRPAGLSTRGFAQHWDETTLEGKEVKKKKKPRKPQACDFTRTCFGLRDARRVPPVPNSGHLQTLASVTVESLEGLLCVSPSRFRIPSLGLQLYWGAGVIMGEA